MAQLCISQLLSLSLPQRVHKIPPIIKVAGLCYRSWPNTSIARACINAAIGLDTETVRQARNVLCLQRCRFRRRWIPQLLFVTSSRRLFKHALTAAVTFKPGTRAEPHPPLAKPLEPNSWHRHWQRATQTVGETICRKSKVGISKCDLKPLLQ